MITDAAGLVTRYHYDDQQQLIREDNPYTHKTYVYTYDRGGNRTSKTTYTYTTGSLTDLTGTVSNYTYEGDRLTATGSTAITYDELGNPLTYGPNAYTWQNGRQLASLSMSYGGLVYSFEYNDSGIRTSKTSLGIKHEYTLNGSQIVTESWVQNGVEHFIVYLYDESGAPIGMQYRTSDYAWGEFDNYFFEKNLFGDVVAVYNEAGTKIGSYTYDAWGICTTSVQSTASAAENKIVRQFNPFRYRGYFYDYDTGLYYLQSRYYNPQWGRFLNADGYVNANGNLVGFNMYAYCSNNPVMYIDPSGTTIEDINWENLGFFEKRFWELMCLFDSFYFNAGIGAGFAGAVENEGLSIEATLNRNSICLKKDAGKAVTFATEEEVALNLSGLCCNFISGFKNTHEMDGTEHEEKYYPTFQPQIGYKASLYFIVGAHLEFGIDLDNFAQKRFGMGIALE